MKAQGGSTAVMNAISRTDLEADTVTEEELNREKLYGITMSHATKMLSEGLITEEQYAIFNTKMLEKYRPIFGTLLSAHDLICAQKRVINGVGKEGLYAENNEN